MFKNLTLYQLGTGWPQSAARLDEALQREPFAGCGPTQALSSGWIPPRGVEHGALVEAVDGQWLACFAIETRPVPGEVLRRAVSERAEQIERDTGRTPGRRELRDLREDLLLELLPQAFTRRTQLTVWIDPNARRLMLGTSSAARADEAISSLVRVAGTGFSVSELHTRESPHSAMAAWLTDGEALPQCLQIGRECELKGSGEAPAVVKFMRHELVTDEVREHIVEGKLPTRLALNWQGRVDFVLTQELQLRKIAFDEGLFDEHSPEGEEERFDADAALATGELTQLLGDLLEALGGVQSAAPSSPRSEPAAGAASDDAGGAAPDDPPF